MATAAHHFPQGSGLLLSDVTPAGPVARIHFLAKVAQSITVERV